MSEIKFSRPQEYVLTTTQDISLFLAGVGSGKTHLLGFKSAYFLENFPHVFGFIGANTYNQLTTSTLYRTREVWKQFFGWTENKDYVINKKPPKHYNTDYHNFDDYNGIISFRWGAVVFKGSLDNAKAHDGKEFGWAMLDETKDSKEEDVKETILTRLRKSGMYITHDYKLTDEKFGELGELNKAYNPLDIFTSPAKVRWINEWFELDDYFPEIQRLIYDKDKFFIKEFKDKCVVISSTYHNESNLPNGYIQKILDNNSADGAKKLIYGNPFVKAGGEFYSGFDRLTHTGDVPYLPEHPIHISFDQNVVPYITATLYQLIDLPDGRTQFRQFDEICLENPRNKTDQLCYEFIKRYGKTCSGLFFYGDPSGRHRDTRTNEHDYIIIERILRKWINNNSNRVPYKHPPVLKRKDFINNAFESVYDIEILIDSKCKKSISDFEFVKEDKNGKKLKERIKDKNNPKRTYEPYGHTSDSFDYIFCKAFERLFMRHFK